MIGAYCGFSFNNFSYPICLSVNSTECFHAGVHRQLEPGIHGKKRVGAFSIVVSGQYEDDKDEGDTM